MKRRQRWGGASLGGMVVLLALTQPTTGEPERPATAPGLATPGPLAPREEQATFRVPRGFRVELVASEPQVVDPVAMAFDENGRLFVAEMRGYPNDGVGSGALTSGKVKLLEDRDGDGFYEKATIFLDKLSLPTSVMPCRGGLLVAVAPDLIFAEDRDGDGQAEQKRRLYTGFHTANIQQMLNSLQWGMDNWIHGCAGSDGGTISSLEKPDFSPVTLRNRNIRFRLEAPGSLEPTSGGGQYGLAEDLWGRWFVNTNSQHLRHVVLPDHALRRNPSLPVRAVTLDIPDHGPACKVFRISPFEGWRVERTRRRKEGPDAHRFPTTELVPGGFSTSTCSPLIYLADLFPAAYRGNVFVCDPANNLIHRDVLEDQGATFVARRGDADCEFLASTDNWFRPVWLTLGPEGALYVLDFYREVIETPRSLPDDIKKKLNLESRGRGRIWRIVPEGTRKFEKPQLGKATTETLVQHLAHANAWWRYTAQRLLVERQDRAAVKPLEQLAATGKNPAGRAHALWTLQGLNALSEERIVAALKDAEAGVREQGVRLAELRLAKSAALRRAVAPLAADPSPKVRFQLALALGAAPGPETAGALARLFQHDHNDPWTRTAVLSSCGERPGDLLTALIRDPSYLKNPSEQQLQALTEIAALVGSVSKNERDLLAVLALASGAKQTAAWQVALLQGLLQGMRGTQRSYERLAKQGSAEMKKALAQVRPFFDQAVTEARAEKAPLESRMAAIRLLGEAPAALAEPVLRDLLTPRQPSTVQLAAVRALAQQETPTVAKDLLSGWNGYSPVVRREVVEALFARTERLHTLLDQVEAKTILPQHLEPVRVDQLRKHRVAAIRQRAEKLLVGSSAAERQKVVTAYRAVLELKSDPVRGKAVFKKNCTTCHRLENEGFEVGPDLLGVLRNKASEQLLNDILDPSKEVDPRYLNYVVTTRRGQTLTGMVIAETASSLTLRRGEKAEDVILRSQIEEIQTTSKSLMPEGLEMQLTKQDVADLISYLIQVSQKK